MINHEDLIPAVAPDRDRTRVQRLLDEEVEDVEAHFDFAINSRLRGCDVVKVRISDVVSGGPVRDRAIVFQQKTRRPVQLELMDTARRRCVHG